MSSLMTCAAVFALVSRSSEGKPNAPKKRVDSARSLTGRLTAILVAIGRSLSIGEDARYPWKHCFSDGASDFTQERFYGPMTAPECRLGEADRSIRTMLSISDPCFRALGSRRAADASVKPCRCLGRRPW